MKQIIKLASCPSNEMLIELMDHNHKAIQDYHAIGKCMDSFKEALRYCNMTMDEVMDEIQNNAFEVMSQL